MRFIRIGESGFDAVIDGSRFDIARGLVIRLPDRLKRQGVVALGQFQCDTGHGGGGAMLDGEDAAIVAVAAEIEVGIAPGMELRLSAQSLAGANGAGTLFCMVDDRDGDGVAPL